MYVVNILNFDNVRKTKGMGIFSPDKRHNGVEISLGKYFMSWLLLVNAKNKKPLIF